MAGLGYFLDSYFVFWFLGTMWDSKKEMEVLYLELRERIFSFLFRFTGNEDLAMDLVQDTFLSFFKNYGSSQISKEDAIPLLYRIARNRSINHSKKFSSLREIGDPSMELHPDFGNLENQILNQDLEERLRICLGELPMEEKEVLILRYMDELNLSQIAQILQVSVSTVSRLIARATSNLLRLAKERGIEWK